MKEETINWQQPKRQIYSSHQKNYW